MGDGVADHVEKQVRSYLTYGILAHGFARARCSSCGYDLLVALACYSYCASSARAAIGVGSTGSPSASGSSYMNRLPSSTRWHRTGRRPSRRYRFTVSSCRPNRVAISSRVNVALCAQIFSSRCQSLELWASRDTSSPMTIPARPRPTSLTSRWNPARPAAEAPEVPEVPGADLGVPRPRHHAPTPSRPSARPASTSVNSAERCSGTFKVPPARRWPGVEAPQGGTGAARGEGAFLLPAPTQPEKASIQAASPWRLSTS